MNVIEKLEPWKAATRSITRHDDESASVRGKVIDQMIAFLEEERKGIDERDAERLDAMTAAAAAEMTSEKPKAAKKPQPKPDDEDL